MDQSMRNAVMAAYGNSKSWQDRVKKMSEGQVVAVYMRLKAKGTIR